MLKVTQGSRKWLDQGLNVEGKDDVIVHAFLWQLLKQKGGFFVFASD